MLHLSPALGEAFGSTTLEGCSACAVSICQLKWQYCDYIHTFASLAENGEEKIWKLPSQRRFWWNFGFPKILQSHQRSRHLLLVMHIASTAQQSSVQVVLLQLPRSLIINRLISSMSNGTLIYRKILRIHHISLLALGLWTLLQHIFLLQTSHQEKLGILVES